MLVWHITLASSVKLCGKMAANTSLSLCFTSPSSSSASFSQLKHRPRFVGVGKRFVSCSAGPLSSLWLGGAVFSSKARVCTALAAVVDEEAALEQGERAEAENDGGVSEEEGRWKLPRATEVYVCNLPRSCDSEQLRQMFQPHGTILSAEVYCFFFQFLLFV